MSNMQGEQLDQQLLSIIDGKEQDDEVISRLLGNHQSRDRYLELVAK